MKKKFAMMLGSSLIAAAFAMPVQADRHDKMDKGRMGMMEGECMMDMAGMRGNCMMMGAHSMTGMVDMIDHDKGMLTLKHGAGDMKLHFPPGAIKDLKNGDTITVNLGFTKGKPGMMK